MRAALGRHRFALAVGVLSAGILLVGGFLLVSALPDLGRAVQAVQTPPQPSASPRSAMALSPIGIEMSPGSDCTACHLTGKGEVGTKAIPVMAHPVAGWRQCTQCHANDRLVKTAPGHSGLHKDDCLVCHRPPEPGASAVPRPHHVYTDEPCVACHGANGKDAPLPADMAGRNNCWICHNGKDFAELFADRSPAPSAAPSTSGGSPGTQPGVTPTPPLEGRRSSPGG